MGVRILKLMPNGEYQAMAEFPCGGYPAKRYPRKSRSWSPDHCKVFRDYLTAHMQERNVTNSPSRCTQFRFEMENPDPFELGDITDFKTWEIRSNSLWDHLRITTSGGAHKTKDVSGFNHEKQVKLRVWLNDKLLKRGQPIPSRMDTEFTFERRAREVDEQLSKRQEAEENRLTAERARREAAHAVFDTAPGTAPGEAGPHVT